jgi:hypothetical protein
MGLAAHVADLGAPLVATGAALETSWVAIWDASESSSGVKRLSEAEKKAAHQALQLELFKTLLTLALNYPDDEAKLDLYMQQSLLEDHPAGLPLPGEAELQLEETGPGSVTFAASASDATTITYWKRLVGETVFILVAEDVPPGGYEITGLAAGDYEFQVNAVNATATGPDSNIISVTIA